MYSDQKMKKKINFNDLSGSQFPKPENSRFLQQIEKCWKIQTSKGCKIEFRRNETANFALRLPQIH